MKVAVIQINSGEDKQANIKKSVAFCEEASARKAKLLLLPEVFHYRGKRPKDMGVLSEKIPGASLESLQVLAKKNRVSILAGSVYEKSLFRNKVFNTSVFIDAKGCIAAKYRKQHLFEAALDKKKINENEIFLPGKKTALILFGGFHFGISICFDLRFPGLYRRYARQGGDVICVPSCFTQKTGQDHWHILLRARAIENLAYVLAPNQVGTDKKGLTAYGHSLIVDPWGKIAAEASGNKEEIIYADLEQKVIKEARKKLPGIIKSKGKHQNSKGKG